MVKLESKIFLKKKDFEYKTHKMVILPIINQCANISYFFDQSQNQYLNFLAKFF